QSNGDAGIQTDIHAGQASQEKPTVHEYILLPFISSNPLLSSTILSSDVNAGDQPEDVNAESTGIFDGAFNDRDLGVEADTNNLDSSIVMSSMGELTFFSGLQVKQKKDDIFISQDKYVAEILKKFGFFKVKPASTLMETSKPLLKDEDG
nr:ribonuclease H-like domain-containing protein [Tanacetum cinerariifolium]